MSQRQKKKSLMEKTNASSSVDSPEIDRSQTEKKTGTNQRSTQKYQRDQNSSNENNLNDDRDIEKLFEIKNPNLNDILHILKEIFRSQQFISAKYDECLIKNKHLEETSKSLINENIKLKKELKELKDKIDTHENILKSKNLEIHGIPNEKAEKLNQTVLNVAKNFGIDMHEEDIDYVYRIKSNRKETTDKPGPIIVSFTRKEIKERILSSRKNRSIFAAEIGFQNSKNQVYINEHLSKRNKELLWQARKIKKEKNYKYAWYKNGNIFLRKSDNTGIIKINDESDLNNL